MGGETILSSTHDLFDILMVIGVVGGGLYHRWQSRRDAERLSEKSSEDARKATTTAASKALKIANKAARALEESSVRLDTMEHKLDQIGGNLGITWVNGARPKMASGFGVTPSSRGTAPRAPRRAKEKV